MGKTVVSVSYHPSLDFLEVMFDQKSGYYDGTDDDRVMVRYDKEGKVIGFAIEGVKDIGTLLDMEFSDKEPEEAASPSADD